MGGAVNDPRDDCVRQPPDRQQREPALHWVIRTPLATPPEGQDTKEWLRG